LEGKFCLVCGQRFIGEYAVNLSDYSLQPSATQQYTLRVTSFTLNPSLHPQNIDTTFMHNRFLRRRDLNVVPSINVDGKAELAILGGVFQSTTPPKAHLKPVYFSLPASPPVIQDQFEQVLNHYECPSLPIYDSDHQTMYTTLFGGTSQYRWDESLQRVVSDLADLPHQIDGVPFIDTVSTIARKA